MELDLDKVNSLLDAKGKKFLGAILGIPGDTAHGFVSPEDAKSKVVYVIVSGKYEQVIHGIFSTREKAEAALPHVRPNDDGIGWCGPDIEEWPLNPTTQELR